MATEATSGALAEGFGLGLRTCSLHNSMEGQGSSSFWSEQIALFFRNDSGGQQTAWATAAALPNFQGPAHHISRDLKQDSRPDADFG